MKHLFTLAALLLTSPALADIPVAAGTDLVALLKTAKGGETYLLADGEYKGGAIVRAQNVTIRAAELNDPVSLLQGAELQPGVVIRGGATGITLYSVKGCTIEGIAFVGQSIRGVWVSSSSKTRVAQCRFDKTGKWGIFTSYSDDVVLEYNRSSGQKQHGIYVSNGGDRPVVRWNWCSDNLRAGIQLNGDGKFVKAALGTRGDGIIDGAVLEGNLLVNNGLDPKNRAAAFNLLVVRNASVVGNHLEGNHGGGISFGSDQPPKLTQWGSTNNVIRNNTVVQALDGLACIRASGRSTGNKFTDNVLSAGKGGITDIDPDSREGLVYVGNTTSYQVINSRPEPVKQPFPPAR